jgi:glucokinase
VEQKLYIGIEIGGTKLQIVLGNQLAEITQRRRFDVVKSDGGEGIRRQIASALPELLNHQKISGVGVGFGGPVDWRTGKICCSHQIEGWSDFEFGQWLQTITGAPVRIDNDANTACLAEALKGAGRASNPVFYVTMGSGVGGGLVVNEQIYHGAIPGEAEIGHVRLEKTGRIVEESCSGWAVDKKIREGIQKHPESILRQMISSKRGAEAQFLRPALESHDPLATEILQETAEDLAFGLSHVTHLAHPQVIVLGGGLSLVGEKLREAVQHHLSRFIMHAFAPGPEIRLAALGEDVVPVGALLLAANAASK